jgi:hypothetical protein
MLGNIACADCGCSLKQCGNKFKINCHKCTRQVCCCKKIHKKGSTISVFLSYSKSVFAAAMGIEILCITSAEIGLNVGLYVFGYHAVGIVLSYITGYSLAAFTTFVTILGRTRPGQRIDSCCSVLEQQANKGFASNLILTFRNFGCGISRLFHILEYPDLNGIIKTSIFILITAESACILTAETVDLIFYKQSVLLSSILGLIVGSFTVVAIEGYRKVRADVTNVKFNYRK